MIRCLPITFLLLLGSVLTLPASDPLSGKLEFNLRDRVPSAKNPEIYELRERPQQWEARKTALIICDMWDLHHCKRAVDRVQEIAPRMNEVITRAREQGVFIIHAPSECMEAYKDTGMRKRAQTAPAAKNLPRDIGTWCKRIPAEEKGKYPIDQDDGGEDDEKEEHAVWAAKLTGMGRNPRAPWKSQYSVLKMDERDAVSDSGIEIWNLLEDRGIKNVILLGVHTNMCVLGRPFGLRQLAKNGKNVVLMRDMTDTMYNPARWPFVSHFRGTDLIIEHIEKFVCPTITSDQLLGGKAFRFKNDVRPTALLLISEDEYRTEQTLPAFVRDVVTDRLGIDTQILIGDSRPPFPIEGVADALTRADLVVLSVRRRSLPAGDLDALKRFLAQGKPLVGIRTASHAFDPKTPLPPQHAAWRTFDPDILGGNYTGHHGAGPHPTIATSSSDHPLLMGVKTPFIAHGSLYKVSPLARTTTTVLTGSIPDKPGEPVAWCNSRGSARVFYTSLGHPDDFQIPAFRRLLANALLWALDRPIPQS